MSVIDNLITDRAQSDVDRVKELKANYYAGTMTEDEKTEWEAGMKGAYNYTDMNRVGEAVAYIAEEIEALPDDLAEYAEENGLSGTVPDSPYPTSVSVSPKTDWDVEDKPSPAQAKTYLANISALKSIFSVSGDLPASVSRLDYTGANNIEAVLLAAHKAFLATKAKLYATMRTLKFTSSSAFSISVSSPGWDGVLEYNTGSGWNTWDGSTIQALKVEDGSYYISFIGTGNTKITGGSSGNWTLTGTGIACKGNIEYLLDYATVLNGEHPSMASLCFKDMFYGCTALTTPPSLPATTLAASCYDRMFHGCTGLVAIPALPATALKASCYASMFYGCTGIKLSTTEQDSYTQAYRIPTSGTGTTATLALTGMFSGVGGTITDTPTINTTYYLHTDNTIVS